MFGSPHHPSKAYAKVGIETGVEAANPHQLIVMLFEGALVVTNQALTEMRAGRIESKGQTISKAIMIIESGLRASLNKDVGGDIALNLDALYQYMSNCLFMANLHNNVTKIEEVRKLLQDLKTAWENMPKQTAAGMESSETISATSSTSAGQPLTNGLSSYRSSSF